MAFDMLDLRKFVNHFLNKQKRQIEVFKDNFPRDDWLRGFLAKHSRFLSHRMYQNISRKRAALSEEEVGKYFENLEKCVNGVPPTNIKL